MKQQPKFNDQRFQQLRERPHADVLIIGGGINGIATFRELALQGVDVALVERSDFVSGASAASSHMVHGGIRYLENGEFRLVKEAVSERNRLLRTAPHYVKPLETTIPVFKTFSGILSAPFRLLITHGRGAPQERGAVLIKLGLMMYDTFSRGGGRVPRHKFHGRRRSLEALPELNPEVLYTATYFDASMPSPERLALDVLGDALASEARTVRAANYVSAIGSNEGSVRLRDEETAEEIDFSAKVIVNTSGPWTDLTNEALGRRSRYMGGTKGSHVVLDNPELYAATAGREMFFEHSDGRIVLIYPLNGRVMVGTTDIEADPREPSVCTDAEIDYFFELVGNVFPEVEVHRSQIVYTFSGIRPLPAHDDTAPGFVSRDYRITRSAIDGTPLLSLVGGKWTTFRALAEHLSNDVLRIIGKRRTISTKNLMIGGGQGFPQSDAGRRRWVATHGEGQRPEVAELLLERYGTRAKEILWALPPDATELPGLPGHFLEEIQFLASREHILHLVDLIFRRTSLAHAGRVTHEGLAAAAAAVAPVLGWSEERRDEEKAMVIDVLREAHRIEVGRAGVVPAP